MALGEEEEGWVEGGCSCKLIESPSFTVSNYPVGISSGGSLA